jgi:hypothetical protein
MPLVAESVPPVCKSTVLNPQIVNDWMGPVEAVICAVPLATLALDPGPGTPALQLPAVNQEPVPPFQSVV